MTIAPRLTAADVIAGLGLAPHPEGGHFRETFRDSRCDAQGRAASTTGGWTLVGCTVAPAFEFAKFELAPPDWTPQF